MTIASRLARPVAPSAVKTSELQQATVASDGSPNTHETSIFLHVENLRGGDFAVFRFDHVTAWVSEPPHNHHSLPKALGLRVHLLGGGDVYLIQFSFETFTELMKDHYRDFDTLFVLSNGGEQTFLRVDHVSAWTNVGRNLKVHLLSGLALPNFFDAGAILQAQSPDQKSVYAKQQDLIAPSSGETSLQ